MLRKSLIFLTLWAAAVTASVPFYASARDQVPAPALSNWWQTKLPQLPSSPAAISQQQSLAQYRGKPLVIHFWAPWCPHCVKEIATLSALYNEYTRAGIQFIGVAVDSASHVEQFTQKVKVPYPLYIAGFGGIELARDFGNTQGGLPFTVILNQAGELHYTALGRRSAAEFRQQLNNL